jgi:hypothetical protein
MWLSQLITHSYENFLYYSTCEIMCGIGTFYRVKFRTSHAKFRIFTYSFTYMKVSKGFCVKIVISHVKLFFHMGNHIKAR